MLFVTVEEVLIAIDGCRDGAPECVESLRDWLCVEDKSFDYQKLEMSEISQALCWRREANTGNGGVRGSQTSKNPRFGAKRQVGNGEK